MCSVSPSSASRSSKMADEHSPLESEIRRLIAVAGPMPLADYMRLALTHPQYGYYITHDPIGAGGDFITAPEISQMFGELIGLWMVAVWQQMGSPENVRVIELGPGAWHVNDRRIPGRENRQRFSYRGRPASHRGQPEIERAAAAQAGSSGNADAVARQARRCPNRPQHHHRQRIHRRTAGSPGDQTVGRMARARRRSRR